MLPHMPELWLIRHGETPWTLSGAHTGRTDIPLTAAGREHALELGRYLAGRDFALVLVSPLQRALETCRLAGFGGSAAIEPDLREWDYGDYEGRTSTEIRAGRPDWTIWTNSPPNGETIEQVTARAGRVLARVEAEAFPAGDAVLFGHGHMLRVLAARWLGLEPADGRLLALAPASVSTLGFERETRVIARWNLTISA
jgi:probable phosphoglycerate mutase